MISFGRLIIGFFVLCLVIASFVYAFGPPSMGQRTSAGNPSPVGQLDASRGLTSAGQPSHHK